MVAPRALLAVLLLAIPRAADAQSIPELIEAGRFDEAAAAAPAAERDQVARAIFQRAYVAGHQRQDFDYAVRGYVAAKRLVTPGDAMHDQLNFWHGFALYSAGVDAQAAQTLATAEATLPMFEEALDLFAATGEYPATVNVNVALLVRTTNSYIEIQQAVIERGR
jgi:hypothetical protein